MAAPPASPAARRFVTGCPAPNNGASDVWPPAAAYPESGPSADGTLAARPQDGSIETYAWAPGWPGVAWDGTGADVTGVAGQPAGDRRGRQPRVHPCSPAATRRPFRSETSRYRILLVPNARRFAAGHRIQPMVTSDDQPEDITILLGYRHAPVGTTARNTIQATSRLLAPVLARGD